MKASFFIQSTQQEGDNMTGENVTQIKNFSINIENLSLTIKFDELSRPTATDDLTLFANMINMILANAIQNSAGSPTEVHVKRDSAA